VNDAERLQRLELRRRIVSLKASAEAVLLPWIAAETAAGRSARERALDEVSRAMVDLAAVLELQEPR